LADDCLDPLTQSIRHWPWPTKDWRFNSFAIRAMKLSVLIRDLLLKDPAEWTPADDKLFDWMHRSSNPIQQ
jgi:hypothetical protein